MAKRLTLAVGQTEHTIVLDDNRDGEIEMQIDGQTRHVLLQRVGQSDLYRLTVDGRTTDVVITRARSGLNVSVGADTHNVVVQRALPEKMGVELEIAEGELAITAPMTGSVLEVLVAPGDTVAKGDALLVIVAMKMNNEIRSPANAAVVSLQVQPGDSVNLGALLLVLNVQPA